MVCRVSRKICGMKGVRRQEKKRVVCRVSEEARHYTVDYYTINFCHHAADEPVGCHKKRNVCGWYVGCQKK